MSDADEQLSEAFHRLNERFYASKPSGYFDHRLNNLLVAAAEDPEMRSQLRSGIKVCNDEFKVDDDERINSPLPAEELGRFVTAESLILFSHVAEAALRMYLGHAGDPSCPWYEIGRLPFGDFWEQLESRFSSSAMSAPLSAEMAGVFFGSHVHHDGLSLTENEWEAALERIHRWLRYLWQELDSHREVYNAAKHGFATRADQAAFLLTDDSGKQVMGHEGPSLEILTHTQWSEDGTRTWALKTVWVDTVLLWACTTTASRLLEGMWSVGRMRRGFEAPHGKVAVFLPEHTPHDYRMAVGSRMMHFFSLNMFEEGKREFREPPTGPTS